MSTEIIIIDDCSLDDCKIDDCVEHRSLIEESWREACKERWYRSQRAGYDKGEEAIREWVKEHWRGFLRARWIEHMEGSRFWLELNRNDFGLLKRRDLVNARDLLHEIVEQLRRGDENLHIICNARKTKSAAEIDTILKLLDVINVNANRLRCSFCDG